MTESVLSLHHDTPDRSPDCLSAMFYSSFNSKNMKINFEESPRVKCLVLPEIVVVELSEDNGILSGLMTL